MTSYFILKAGEQSGPFTLNQLRSMWANGTLRADTLYWRDGMNEWVLLAELIDGEPIPTACTSDAHPNATGMEKEEPMDLITILRPILSRADELAMRCATKWKLQKSTVYTVCVVVALLAFLLFLSLFSTSSPHSREVSLPLTLQRPTKSSSTWDCPACGGKGIPYLAGDCHRCEGRGTIRTPSGLEAVCTFCGGNGKDRTPCRRCRGTGQVAAFE